ncbi:hypothetical protein DB346_23980 [Verrucomicrobia bacterium LW23]|nr:hypothetical protein DB346_23980 [Verrucomicrobia bacterium LW23]
MIAKSHPSSITIRPSRQMFGDVTVPGDKMIAQIGVLLAAMGDGESVITGYPWFGENIRLPQALQGLGVHINTSMADGEPATLAGVPAPTPPTASNIASSDSTPGGYGQATPTAAELNLPPMPGSLHIRGCRRQLSPLAEPLDCGESGTALRLLTALLAGQPFATRITAGAHLSSLKLQPLMAVLGHMKADIRPQGPAADRPPFLVNPAPVKGIQLRAPHDNGQLKTAVLLAGLFAQGTTSIIQQRPARNHVEKMLEHFHCRPIVQGQTVRIKGGSTLYGEDLRIPGDFTLAAAWIGAAAAMPRGLVTVRDIGLNPNRTKFLRVLLRMGADIHARETSGTMSSRAYTRAVLAGPIFLRESVDYSGPEPVGFLTVTGRALRGVRVEAEEIPYLVDELPVIVAMAAVASGETVIEGLGELRAKSPDRMAAMAENLRAMGVPVVERPDSMEIQGSGGRSLRGAPVSTYGDALIGIGTAVAAIFARGTTTITEAACIYGAYPDFYADLQRLTGTDESTWTKLARKVSRMVET